VNSEDPILADCEFAGIDFESAGAGQGETDVPVQIGIGLLREKGTVLDELLRSYLAPERPIIWSAADVHGIRAADLDGAPCFADIWPEVSRLLRGRIAVAHGAGTERKFLRTFPLHGFGPWLDTLILARKTLPHLQDYSLGTCAIHLGVAEECVELCSGMGKNGRDLSWHDALFDTVASLLVIREIIDQLQLWDLPLSAMRELGCLHG